MVNLLHIKINQFFTIIILGRRAHIISVIVIVRFLFCSNFYGISKFSHHE